MGGISVNLLPKDVILRRKQNSRLTLITKISTSLLLMLIFFTSATIAIRMVQRNDLQSAQQNLVHAEDKVKSFSLKEEQAIALKNKLDIIQSIMGGDTKRKEIFNTVVHLTPSDIQITDAIVDSSGAMTVSLKGSSISSIETLFSNLGKKESGLDLSQLNLDGISLGKDSVYTFALKIVPKKS